MAMPIVPSIKCDRICCKKTPHELRKGRFFPTFKKKVKMIVHEAVSMNFEFENQAISGQIFVKYFLVVSILKSNITTVRPGKYMIKAVWKINSLWARHDLRILSFYFINNNE